MQNKIHSSDAKPSVSIILPGYNEEEIVVRNLGILYEYLTGLEEKYSWEILFINDGSTDKTGILADEFARNNPKVRVLHHHVNLNLGNALQTGFAHATGYYTITMDIDLSYAPYHIGVLLDTLVNTRADVVITSPYMKGGNVTAVPFLRRVMSREANRFMRMAAQDKLHTFTSMVRGYRTEFLKGLNLKTRNYEINPEILYKSMILRARIVEIPAHLDWTEQNKIKTTRKSGMRIAKTFFSSLMAGFIFRPYLFFLLFGFILLIAAGYIITWIFINTFSIISEIVITNPVFIDDRFSLALGQVFRDSPHSFMVGGITLLAAIQILSLGFISLQNKRYFEEQFHISSHILKILDEQKTSKES